MGKKEPAWRSYEKVMQQHLPRLTKEGNEEELSHRARLLWARDWASGKRESVEWYTDNLLATICSLVTAYAISSKTDPAQAKLLSEAITDLMNASAKLQATGLR